MSSSTKILALPAISLELMDPTEPYCVVSVTDPGYPWVPPINQNQFCRGVLRCKFYDADTGPGVITEEIAAQICDFVEKKHAEGVRFFVFSCIAAMSRSPAMAAAFDAHYNGSDQIWFATKTPNRRVYRMLCERLFG